MEVTRIVLQSLLQMASDGDVFTSLIYLFTTMYETMLVSHSHVLTVAFHLFGSHVQPLFQSLDVVDLIKFTRL